jgi:Calcineurin-like phosphoesterase
VYDVVQRRERMVEWLSPTGLFVTGVNVVLSSVFSRFADKRELEGALPGSTPTRYSSQNELWLDYVADTGDGWDATYTVAQHLCQKHEVPGSYSTEPGDVLILGGDQVYPAATYDRYVRRLVVPFSAAAGTLPQKRHQRAMFAVPGNHDWYDGLTSFMRIFGRGRTFADAWQAPQARSYFAVQLPGRWWLLGIDIAFDAYLDSAQVEHFRRLTGSTPDHIRKNDRIILCTGKPTWASRTIRGDHRIRTHSQGTLLQDFEEELIEGWGCDVALVLSGDLHHYAHYVSADGAHHRITSGCGGAYLYPTHGLRPLVEWPPRTHPPQEKWKLSATYPTGRVSKRLRKRIPLGPFKNRSYLVLAGLFAVLVGSQARPGFSALNFSILQSLDRIGPSQLVVRIFTRPASGLIIFALLAALYAFADGDRASHKWMMAATHWVFQVIGIVCALWAGAVVATAAFGVSKSHDLSLPLTLVASGFAIGVVFFVGAFLGALILGGYLWLMERLGRHATEAFSALAIPDFKGFVRMRVRDDGSLTVFAFGVDRVARGVDLNQLDSSTAALVDSGVRLVDEPVNFAQRAP